MKPISIDFLEEYIPSREDARQAEKTIKDLSILDSKKKSLKFELILKTQDISKNLSFPHNFLPFIIDVLQQVAHGNTVTIVPSNKDFTTQEAANILNVSRPFIIKLLESGEIAFHKIGSHRRIQAKDLMSYKQKMHKKSMDALKELAKMAQDDKTGYEE